MYQHVKISTCESVKVSVCQGVKVSTPTTFITKAEEKHSHGKQHTFSR